MTQKPCCPMPVWPRFVGLLGTTPFFLLALASWTRGQWQLTSQDALLVYAAFILTGIGFMHLAISTLGRERGRHLSYRWSVLPALMGWAALLMSQLLAVLVLLLGFWLHYMQDRRLSGRTILPEWYLPMRFVLTTAASLALLLGGAAMLLGSASVWTGADGAI